MKLFLSYNSKNFPFIDPIARKLIGDGFEAFYDKESIAPGDIWVKKIQEGINTSDASLVFIGEEGLGGWQNKEVLAIVNEASKSETHQVIPVILPSNGKVANTHMPWFLADYQWVEFKDPNDAFAYGKLFDSLRPSIAGKSDVPMTGNPYKGLSSFDVEDSRCFFGRTYDLNLVFHNKLRFQLSIPGHNFLAVVGDSGAGKSSFIKAGILAALKAGRFAKSAEWRQIIFKPGGSPLGSLSSQLKQQGLITDSRTFEEKAMKYDDELLRVFRDQDKVHVIYIDQFEEVLTQCKSEVERVAFLNNIVQAAETEKAIVLLSLRSDFYAAFAPYTLFKHMLESHNYTLSAIEHLRFTDGDDNHLLREIIASPAKYAGVRVASDLVDTLINDLAPVKGVLPILQLTLDLLWKHKGDRTTIVLNDYAAISGNKNLQGIIEKHGTEVYNNVTLSGSDTIKADLFRRIFIPYLVEVGGGGNDVRRTALKEEILGMTGHSRQEIEAMIGALTDERSRLLTVLGDDGEGEKVQVVHEVLIREWPLLRRWVDERRSALLFFDRLDQDARFWKTGGNGLYSGHSLQRAINHLRDNPDLTNTGITEFVSRSRRVRRNSRIIGLSALVVVLGITSFLYSGYQDRNFRTKVKTLASLETQLENYGNDPDSVTRLEIDYEVNDGILTADDMRRFTHLDTLIIDNKHIRDLSLLKHCASLRMLTITVDTNLANLSGIEGATALEKLAINCNFSGSQLNTAGNLQFGINLKGIDQLHSLRSLILFGFASKNVFRDLGAMPSVDSLEINSFQNLRDLRGIEKFTGLRELKLYSNGKLASLAGIQQLTGLKSVEIVYSPALTDLRELDGLHSLDSIRINDLSSLTSLKIGNLPSVRFFEMKEVTSLQDLAGIQRLPALETLIIEGAHLRHLDGLGHLDSLKSLILRQIDSNLKDLRGIGGAPSLQMLTIENCFSVTSLAGLDHLPRLYFLVVKGDTMSLSGMHDLPSLTDLTIGFCRGADLKDIGSLPSLTSLTMYYDEINSLNGIQGLKHLKSLELSQNKKLVDYRPLSSLPALTSLKLESQQNFTRIDQLHLPSSLRSLYFNSTLLTTLAGSTRLDSLATLSILGCNQLPSLSGIGRFSALRKLFVGADAGLISTQGIDSLSILDTLQMFSNASLFTITPIYKLHRLKFVTFEDQYHLDTALLRKNNPDVR